MAYDSEEATQAALDKIAASPLFRGSQLTEQLEVFVRAICEAVGEQVPNIQDVGGEYPSPSHQ